MQYCRPHVRVVCQSNEPLENMMSMMGAGGGGGGGMNPAMMQQSMAQMGGM
jgi:hypothetical protein